MAKFSLQSFLGEFAVSNFALVKKVNLLHVKFEWFLLLQPFVANAGNMKISKCIEFFVSKSIKYTYLHVFHVNLLLCMLS